MTKYAAITNLTGILARAAHRLETNGWTSDTSRRCVPGTPMTIEMAIRQVMRMKDVQAAHRLYELVLLVLSDGILRKGADVPAKETPARIVALWSSKPGRTKSEVVTLLRWCVHDITSGEAMARIVAQAINLLLDAKVALRDNIAGYNGNGQGLDAEGKLIGGQSYSLFGDAADKLISGSHQLTGTDWRGIFEYVFKAIMTIRGESEGLNAAIVNELHEKMRRINDLQEAYTAS